jgi:hypothetical protein
MDALYTAHRLREQAHWRQDEPLPVEAILPRYCQTAFVRVAGLSIERLAGWLRGRGILRPGCLTSCGDRALRGAVVAWGGYGLLIAELSDDLAEQAYTFAHEAGHYLGDHLYPRLELAAALGTSALEALDGLRPPTEAERFHAILRRRDLSRFTHLLARDDDGAAESVVEAEREADRFACELLAPCSLVESHLYGARPDPDSLPRLVSLLRDELGLPPSAAARYAHRFSLPESGGLLTRLGIV